MCVYVEIQKTEGKCKQAYFEPSAEEWGLRVVSVIAITVWLVSLMSLSHCKCPWIKNVNNIAQNALYSALASFL